MKATLLKKQRTALDENSVAHIKVWRVPKPVPGSTHEYKYSLALVVNDVCVLRYDNEAGKGDHKHMGEAESEYTFTTLDQLIDDFFTDIKNEGH